MDRPSESRKRRRLQQNTQKATARLSPVLPCGCRGVVVTARQRKGWRKGTGDAWAVAGVRMCKEH